MQNFVPAHPAFHFEADWYNVNTGVSLDRRVIYVEGFRPLFDERMYTLMVDWFIEQFTPDQISYFNNNGYAPRLRSIDLT